MAPSKKNYSKFSQRVIEIIKNIPKGKVSTYGQVAALAGNYQASRQVAWILHSLSEQENLPWHRVINCDGKISLKQGYGYENQKELLSEEGISFDGNDRIDFDKYLWQPQLKIRKK